MLDVGIFTFDPRQEQYQRYGLDLLLQEIKVDVALPMHFWDRYDLIEQYLMEGRGRPRLISIHEKGETYEV